ncbi:hypothetical protein PHISCL_02323 [Aspergillus sclerotialis]|uniref:Uncharacterized protein n=1 Tax=Aspergillus sclerotialis TaxID=2070753 RepID=A0A3A2ZRN2_9EURO|nr:hypothetical protein PHISCL_02323 [Aspergillus sclerotialis]
MPKLATSSRRVRFAPFPKATPDAIDEILQSLEEQSPRSTIPNTSQPLRRGSIESNGANPIGPADRYPRTPVAHLFINNKTVMSSSKDWSTVLDPVRSYIATSAPTANIRRQHKAYSAESRQVHPKKSETQSTPHRRHNKTGIV